jgi:hypothetical protein
MSNKVVILELLDFCKYSKQKSGNRIVILELYFVITKIIYKNHEENIGDPPPINYYINLPILDYFLLLT